MRGRKPTFIELSALERQGLEKLIKGHNTRQQIALRSQIILAAAEGKNNSQISIEFQIIHIKRTSTYIGTPSVCKITNTFEGMQGAVL